MRSQRREDEITTKELMHILYATQPNFRSYQPNSRYDYDHGIDCDEVYPNIFIGDENAARSKIFLRRNGITHVVNMAQGKLLGMVDTDQEFYKNTNIKYMGVCLMDLPVTNISVYFERVADFIENGIKNGGKVLVHCVMGVSRSSTSVLAYLMLKERLSACEALSKIRKIRDIRPNDGFLFQLAQLDNKLKRERMRGIFL
uniref:Dual specificity protein phosphatase n=1 Tax=Clastoptera arizonana TaxID=38151 RepID=A0A1B6CWU0_9HEMI